jgi:hypothetical protein
MSMSLRRGSADRWSGRGTVCASTVLQLAWLLGAGMIAEARASDCEVRTSALLPVLELYTSEGCSSCPPADAWLSAEVEAGIGDALVPLAFHVDYWDYLGWRDRFADPRHAVRQRARVHASGGRVVYTPQVMLGNEVQLTGRERERVRETARALSATAPPVDAGLAVSRDGQSLEVHVQGRLRSAGQPLQAWLLLWSNGLTSEVAAGENRSRRLNHDRVVRVWQGPWPLAADQPLSGLTRIELPEDRGTESGLTLMFSAEVAASGWAVDFSLAGCAPET